MLKRALSIRAYALYVRAYQLLRACRPCSCRALELLNCFFRGESAFPFIDEGGGLTSQRRKWRECVRVLPNLVAHIVGYDMPSPTLLFMTCCTWQAAQCSPTLLFMTWKATQCSPGMANDGAHNTVCGLMHLEGCIVFVCHDLEAPSCRCTGYGRVRSLVLRLT